MSVDTPGSTDGPQSRWEGYSDYRHVSGRMAEVIFDAVEAFAEIDARHTEGARVSPEQAAEARRKIHAAIMNVRYEMEQDRDAVDEFDQILTRWDDEQLIMQFHNSQFTSSLPGAVGQLVADVRAAGWELGYLQAGRTSTTDPADAIEAETDAMVPFE